jgi:predicted DNA-binding transcriptional regulator YafY
MLRSSHLTSERMPYEKTEALLRLALDMSSTAEGFSLLDIQNRYEVARRTGERMRDALERIFPGMEQANPGETPKRWRIRNNMLNKVIGFSVEEIAALTTAGQMAGRDNLSDLSARLDSVATKVKATISPRAKTRIETDLEALTEAEGIALRPGPRQHIPTAHLADLRLAIMACLKVRLHYRASGTGQLSRQLVCPYGFLYGNRHYLVAYSTNDQARDYRLFRLGNIERIEVTNEPFRRRKDFSLKRYAERSFGVFQEEPFDVVWRFSPEAAPDARQFLFHPTQTTEDQPDGSLIVRFRAGGALEMSWHLVTWGAEVEVIKPKRLRALQKS